MKSVLYDTSDFAKIIQGGNVYVDKTSMLHRLVTDRSGSRFFISRPRRFGKSLMLSTLECIFRARRDLFEGLAIAQTDYAWPEGPVIHLDMSAVLADNVDELRKNIVNMIRLSAEANDVPIDFSSFSTHSSCFGALISGVVRKFQAPVAVLIDEYDAPVNRLIEDGVGHSDVSSVLHDFYVQLKVNDANIKFLMMTGDAVLQIPDSVFIFEFKYNHTAEAALTQAEEKDYGVQFANGKRRVFLIGVNYNPKERNIDPPRCKELQLATTTSIGN